MKQFKKPFLLAVALLLSANFVSAYDFEVDGIYYNILFSSSKTCEVTYRNTYYNSYDGDIVIPSTVMYDSKEYTVKAVGSNAFCESSGLTSITIPNSVTSIGSSAFDGCSGLTTIKVDAEKKI